MRRSARALLLAAATVVAPVTAAEAAMREHLEPTPWIDADHPRIVETARRVAAGAASDREKAVRLHDFVRDEVRFGWTRRFYRMKASEVLAARVGYCNTKATLFIALLRAAGIPARQRFVDIRADVLAGLLEPGGRYVDHSVTELRLEGRWLRVDSYVADLPLFVGAKAKLAESGALLGWGVHRNGVAVWDGTTDAFVQWMDDGSVPDLTTVDHGVFADSVAFYEAGLGRDRLAGLRGVLIRLFAPGGGARAEALRAAARGRPATSAASGSPS